MLRHWYPDRWLRVHSLPESKRYADSDEEYQELLMRHNQLFSDLVGDGKAVISSFGLYLREDDSVEFIDAQKKDYRSLPDFDSYVKVNSIDLHELSPDMYDIGVYFNLYVKDGIWVSGTLNGVLKAIANDEIRVVFISPSTNCIISPYDGGVDIIVGSTDERDKLKVKYSNWLSDREDSL
jgi:hypothetical protein